jgi:hypothetical protein
MQETDVFVMVSIIPLSSSSLMNLSHAAVTTAIAFGDQLCPRLSNPLSRESLLGPSHAQILKEKLGMCLVLH